MIRIKEILAISILYIAGVVMLGHAFIPHHHHHSDFSEHSCSHQHDHHGDHSHDGFEGNSCDHSGSGTECDECHLDDDFVLQWASIIPIVYCTQKQTRTFIPQKEEASLQDFVFINNYTYRYTRCLSHRGPPSTTSFSA